MSSNVSKNRCPGKGQQNAAKFEELVQEQNGEIEELVLLPKITRQPATAHGKRPRRQRGQRKQEGGNEKIKYQKHDDEEDDDGDDGDGD